MSFCIVFLDFLLLFSLSIPLFVVALLHRPSNTIWVERRAKSEKSAKICTIFFWYTLFCFLRWARYHKNRLPKRINLMRVYHSSLLRNCSFSQNVQIHTHTRHTRARVRLPTAMLIFCCHKCHTFRHCSFLCLTSLRTFSPSFLPFRPSPTNDTLFSTKRHVVFNKMTRRFS